MFCWELEDARLGGGADQRSSHRTHRHRDVQLLTFFAETITYTPTGGSAHAVQGVIVYEGETGYIAEGVEPTAAALILPEFES